MLLTHTMDKKICLEALGRRGGDLFLRFILHFARFVSSLGSRPCNLLCNLQIFSKQKPKLLVCEHIHGA